MSRDPIPAYLHPGAPRVVELCDVAGALRARFGTVPFVSNGAALVVWSWWIRPGGWLAEINTPEFAAELESVDRVFVR